MTALTAHIAQTARGGSTRSLSIFKYTRLVNHAYCTYCSHLKDEDPAPLRAIDRYQSQRIQHVYQQSIENQVRFFILSGKFGLIRPDTEILSYDHLLSADEVDAMITKAQTQLKPQNIKTLFYFTASPQDQPAVQAYLDVMVAACSAEKIECRVTLLDAPYLD